VKFFPAIKGINLTDECGPGEPRFQHDPSPGAGGGQRIFTRRPVKMLFYREKRLGDGSTDKKRAAAFFAGIRHLLQHWQ